MKGSYLVLVLILVQMGCEKNSSKSDSSTKTITREMQQDSLNNLTVTAYKKNKYGIDTFNNGGLIEHDLYTRLQNILNLNVVEYYSLKNEFKTELQRKHYSKSNDYKTKLKKLQREKRKLTDSLSYIVWSLTSQNLVYDLATNSFTINKVKDGRNSDTEPASLLFGDLEFDPPFPKNFNVRSNSYMIEGLHVEKILGEYYFLRGPVWRLVQNISLQVNDEKTALKIEKNNDKIYMLISFSFIRARSDALDAKIKHVLLYNNTSKEIYKIFI